MGFNSGWHIKETIHTNKLYTHMYTYIYTHTHIYTHIYDYCQRQNTKKQQFRSKKTNLRAQEKLPAMHNKKGSPRKCFFSIDGNRQQRKSYIKTKGEGQFQGISADVVQFSSTQ